MAPLQGTALRPMTRCGLILRRSIGRDRGGCVGWSREYKPLWRYALVLWLWVLASCEDQNSLLAQLYKEGLKLASVADLPAAPLRAEVLGEWVCGEESLIVKRHGGEYALTVLSTSLHRSDTELRGREVWVGGRRLVALGVPRRSGEVWLLAGLRRNGDDLVVDVIRDSREEPDVQLRWLATHPDETLSASGEGLTSEYLFLPALEPVRAAQQRNLEIQIDTLEAYALYAARFPEHPDLPGVLTLAVSRIVSTGSDIGELGRVADRFPALAAEAEARAVILAVDPRTMIDFASAFPRSAQRDVLLSRALSLAETEEDLMLLLEQVPEHPVARLAAKRLQEVALAVAVTDDQLTALLDRWPDDVAWGRRVQAIRVLRRLSSDPIRFYHYGVTLAPEGQAALEEIVRFVRMANEPDEVLPELYLISRVAEPDLPADAAFLLSCDRASTLGAHLRKALPEVAIHLIPVGADADGLPVEFAVVWAAATADRERYSQAVVEHGGGATLPDPEGEHAGGTWISGPRMREVVLGRLEDELAALASGRLAVPVVPPELWYGLCAPDEGDDTTCADVGRAFRREAKDLARDIGVRHKDLEGLVESSPR